MPGNTTSCFGIFRRVRFALACQTEPLLMILRQKPFGVSVFLLSLESFQTDADLLYRDAYARLARRARQVQDNTDRGR